MRIVIDLQPCQSGSRYRGVGRYSMSLTKAIARQAGDHEIWIVFSDRFPDAIPYIRMELDGLVPRERIVTFSVPGPTAEENSGNRWRARSAELLREHFLAGLNPDIVHVSNLFEGWEQSYVSSIDLLDHQTPTTVTLYDLIPLVNQQSYLLDPEVRAYYFRKIESLKKASFLLAISEYSRQEAIRELGFREESIVNISSAVDSEFRVCEISPDEQRKLLYRYKITRPFVMYTPGGFDIRKNIIGLITAYSKLPDHIRNGHQLVITGKIHERPHIKNVQHIKSLGLREDEVVFTDYVGDEDLIALYNTCKLFVFPSLYEGFGLPVLEAMACGAPVIASNTTSLPEILGRSDASFDPTQPDDITRLMLFALENADFRRSLKDYGSEQAKKFSWDYSAQSALKAFEEVNRTKALDVSRSQISHAQSHQELFNCIAQIKSVPKPTNLDLVRTANSIAFNSPVPGQRQILTDISVLVHGDAKSGIQRVVRSILLELLTKPPEGYAVRPIYFDGQRYRYANRFTADFLSNQVFGYEDDVVDIVRGDIYLGLDLSAHLTEVIHDYLKRLNLLGIELYFTVYDILLAQHPEWWPEGTGKVFVQWLNLVTEVATGLVCISHSVADNIGEWLKLNPINRIEPLKIGYFHLGADIENSVPSTGVPEEAEEILKLLKSAPSFLMVGTIEPRKGHTQALSAFELLWDQGQDVNLVIVGKRGWLVDELVERISTHPMLGKRLFWLEGISDEYLDRIYQHSKAALMASEGEGFGLPIIEAARHGIPLILRDIPVFREVAGEHATYFNGHGPRTLSTVIVDWLMRDQIGNVPSSKGIDYLTWNDSVKALLSLMQNKEDPHWVRIWGGKVPDD
jgi:glycosyltransferase involved in cell wall biosynthesis